MPVFEAPTVVAPPPPPPLHPGLASAPPLLPCGGLTGGVLPDPPAPLF